MEPAGRSLLGGARPHRRALCRSAAVRRALGPDGAARPWVDSKVRARKCVGPHNAGRAPALRRGTGPDQGRCGPAGGALSRL